MHHLSLGTAPIRRQHQPLGQAPPRPRSFDPPFPLTQKFESRLGFFVLTIKRADSAPCDWEVWLREALRNLNLGASRFHKAISGSLS